MYKILHVLRRSDPAGGGPIEGVLQRGRVLAQQGHHLELATLDAPSDTHAADSGFAIHRLGPGRLSYGYSTKLLRWLAANANRFDAIVVHGLWQFQGMAVRHAARLAGVPYFVFPHGMLDPWFKRQYPLKHLKKWAYWPWGEYRVLRDASAVLFTTQQEMDDAATSFVLHKWTGAVVNYGTATPPDNIDEQVGAFFEKAPQLRGRRFLLFLSRIHPKKGCDLLIEAYANAAFSKGIDLVLAGPDQVGWVAELRRLAQSKGCGERVHFVGMLQGNEKWGALRAAEAFVLPSHQENFGIAVAEAIACGVPVLISDKVNIHHEISGFGAGLVGEDTLEGVRGLLSHWLALHRADRQRMQSNALRCFREKFEVHAAAESLISVFGAHGAPPRP